MNSSAFINTQGLFNKKRSMELNLVWVERACQDALVQDDLHAIEALELEWRCLTEQLTRLDGELAWLGYNGKRRK